jgi:predicted AlkP superfamily phosphohydrolase/phosphomutase
VSGRILLLGLDGMTFSVLDPAFEGGHMPRLRALLERGASGVLRSTIPPYTPPGWTSIFTGVNPGKHGVFGFTLGNVQRPRGLVSLQRVAAPTLWDLANAQGVAMGLFNVPMTYPPPAIEGFAVAGMLTPEGGGATPENFTHPRELGRSLKEAAGGYEIDIEVDYDRDWRTTDIIERLSRNLRAKRRALRGLLDSHRDLPVFFAVLEAPDRLMHVHYKYIDPRCPHFERPEAEAIRERAWAFFDEMDEMVGELVDWAGSDGFVMTMSDHGFGPKDKHVNVNLALRQWGLLGLKGPGSMTELDLVRRVARSLRKRAPKALWRRAKVAALASIDWGRTRAFAGPIPQQGIYVNLEGREPHGVVAPADYEAVRDEVADRLRELVDPDDGQPVVDEVYRREEVIHGPRAHDAPDLYPVCRGYSYELSDAVYSPSVLDDHRDLPRGFHNLDGIFGISGRGVAPTERLQASLYDIAPTALYLAGLKLPYDLDGRVLTEALPHDLLESRPVEIGGVELAAPAPPPTESSPYSAEEEQQIENSLRDLGYL